MTSRFVLLLSSLAFAACGGGSPMSPSLPPTPGPSPTPTPAPQPSGSPSPIPSPTPPPGPTVLRAAEMMGSAGHSAAGTVEIVRDGADHTLSFRDNFRIDIGSIDVYLSRSASLDMRRDLNLGALKSRTGAQSYRMPNAGGDYFYVLLWCRPFGIPVGLGRLEAR